MAAIASGPRMHPGTLEKEDPTDGATKTPVYNPCGGSVLMNLLDAHQMYGNRRTRPNKKTLVLTRRPPSKQQAAPDLERDGP